MASEQLEGLRTMLSGAPIDPGAAPTDWRAGIDLVGSITPLAEGTRVEVVDAGGVPAELVRPADGADVDGTAALYLHSGGYGFGSITSHRPMASHLAAAVGAPVLLIDYRLAPEHPYPAAVDDALAAWRWLVAEGHDPARTGVAGDSAGGGLTLVLATRLREAGAPLPGALACLSPWCDLTGTSPTLEANRATDVVLSPELLAVCAANVAGTTPLDDPGLSPRFADLSGLPPMLVQATDGEILVGDARGTVAAARAAGVDVTYDERPGLLHDWHLFADLPEARQDLARVGEFLRAHLA